MNSGDKNKLITKKTLIRDLKKKKKDLYMFTFYLQRKFTLYTHTK